MPPRKRKAAAPVSRTAAVALSALDVECPNCKAVVGAPCVNLATGEPKPDTPCRVRAARAMGSDDGV